MLKTKKVSFHESTVLHFSQDKEIVKLELDDVKVDGAGKKAFLIFSGVKSIESDSDLMDSNLMPAPDGEVLSLELTEKTIKLIVES